MYVILKKTSCINVLIKTLPDTISNEVIYLWNNSGENDLYHFWQMKVHLVLQSGFSATIGEI